jgi:RNA polymerase sigma-70 factor (ECF subfamily)
MDERHRASPIPIEQFRGLALAELSALYRFAFHLTRNGHDADELVQETYARALAARERFRLGPVGIRPWLFRILHNLLRNQRRVMSMQNLSGIEGETIESTPEGSGGAMRADDLNWDQMDERLVAAVHELPHEYRAVFLLFAVEDLKYREIASVLEIPIGTVMSRLARARKQLMLRLGKGTTAQDLREDVTPCGAGD